VADVKPTVPLWLEDAYAPRPPLRGDVAADACVIGGGVGGLATAWKLLDRGLSVVLLEAREIAGGASGRNGGFFISGAAPMYHDARSRWGAERAAAIQRATLDAQREMLDVAIAIGARSHFRMAGMLRLAVDAEEADDVRAHAAALIEDGFAAELVEPSALPAPLSAPERLGLVSPDDGAVHPARWLRALAAALERRGARIYEDTVALDHEVHTANGSVRAARVVVAMDGGLAALVPSARAVRPRRLNMLATEPVPRVFPMPVYARYGHEYLQQTMDGRIALGGFSDLDGEASWTDREELSEPVQRRLDEYLHDELSVDAAVTHRWVGVVGYADDPLPRCGAVPGSGGRVLALGGYNGTGHVQAWVAAGVVAALAAGEAAENPYAEIAAP
jgi:glycine/D-amino acid oxidase-like deaminating enzyme